MPRHGNEANFSSFFTSQTLNCSIAQNIQAKPCRFILGIHVLPLNLTEKGSKCNELKFSTHFLQLFRKVGHFWIQIKVA